MKFITGLFLIIIAFLGYIFFSYYNGTLIGHTTVWRIACIMIAIAGYLLIRMSAQKDSNEADAVMQEMIRDFKSKAVKIELNFDQCEFHEGSYSDHVTDPDLEKLQVLSAFAVNSTYASIMDTARETTILQSWLRYNQVEGNLTETFISSFFPVDSTTLRFHVMSKQLELWVDPHDRKRYMFMKKEG